MLPVLVGENPSKTGDRYHAFPLSGAVGQRLCEFAGIEPDSHGTRYGRWYWPLREHFECHNVFERYADATPWNAVKAQHAWSEYLMENKPNDRLIVVCLGVKVAKAVGHDEGFFEWYEDSTVATCCIPHPSARNRLYNDPHVREAAGGTLQEAMWMATEAG